MTQLDLHFHIKHGNKYAYDLNGPTPPGTHWTVIAARGVLSNLKGRRGVGNELEEVDMDVREEIVESIAQIIKDAHVNQPFGVLESIDFSKL